MRVFAVYFWHSEGWTQRDEALVGATVKQVRTTRRQQKAIQLADPKAQMASLSRERTTVSSPVTVLKGRSRTGAWWKISNQDHTMWLLSWWNEIRIPGMRGAKTAKSFTRTQWWWEAARTKQSVRRMRRRNRSTASRGGGVQILKEEEADAKPLARCEEEKQD